MSRMPDSGSRSVPLSRRELLRQAGLLTVGLATTPVSGWPRSWFRDQEVVVPFTDVPANFVARRPDPPNGFPGQGVLAQDLRELRSWITPADEFFVVSHYNIPAVDAASYRLELRGLVGRPLSLTLDDLKRRPKVEKTTTFECGGNARARMHGMIGNATWGGVDLRALLADVQPSDLAREVHFWGSDSGNEEIRGQQYEQNFARSMSLEAIAETSPMLAYEMNGQPLPIVHGFPVRLIVPGWYGVAQVKWLRRIDVSTDRLMTRFMARDYVTLMGREVDGRTEWVETSVSRQQIKSMIARVTRSGDRFTVFGVAFNDGTPIERVEIQVDGGAWQPARVDRQDNPHTWAFFSFETTGLTPGEHTLTSRATDSHGRTQPADLSMKRTRWENNELFVRTISV